MSELTRLAVRVPFLVSLALPAFWGCGGDTIQECLVGQERCGDVCADLKADPQHCGACDRVCVAPADQCVDGACSAGGEGEGEGEGEEGEGEEGEGEEGEGEEGEGEEGEGEEGEGEEGEGEEGEGEEGEGEEGEGEGEGECELTACPDGACADLARDPEHCGDCENACRPGEVCAAGDCACPQGRRDCGDSCVDTTSDPENCGECGNECPWGSACIDSECQCAADECWEYCTDLDRDVSNCGWCGNTCWEDRYCVEGDCQCLPGLVWCGGGMGGGGRCTPVEHSPFNCGECGNRCDGENRGCADGECVQDCDDDDDRCDVDVWGNEPDMFYCTDFDTDPVNCGSCGNSCAPWEVCVEGSCTEFWDAAGCDQCPCDAGCGDNACCGFPGDDEVPPICVSGDLCP